MSDRSYAQVIVWDCPEDQRAACRAAIFEAFDRHTHWRAIETLVLGDRYGDDECGLDMNDTIASAIIAAAPGATFEAWVDPKYEYPGVLTAYAPDLGRWDGVCDADGTPYATSHELLGLIDKAETMTALREGIDKLLGSAWQRRARELREALNPPAVA